MAAFDNTVLAENIAAAQDIEMIRNFTGEVDRLAEILGLFGPEIVAAGTTMYTYKVTGALNSATVAEGDEVPLSEYNVAKTPVGSISVKPYRKLTTAQAILKGGYENAVAKTDKKMLSQARRSVISDFFTFLATGTGTATGAGLQGALAQADAKLQDALETNGDEAEAIAHFVNPYDIADYLSNSEVTVQTVFGMQYIKSFLGVENIFVTNRVAKGTVYVTPTDNIHIYGVDFGALAAAGFDYTVQDGSLIGVHHDVAYNRTSAETYMLVGAFMLAEVLDYIVKAAITAKGAPAVTIDGQPIKVTNAEGASEASEAAPQPAPMAMAAPVSDEEAEDDAVGAGDGATGATAPTEDNTISEIRAYAAAEGIELPAKATKAEMLAIVRGE